MATLSYSFCMSLLHSIWQAALLWLIYVIADKSLRQQFSPLQKKNLLFVSLAVQAVLFAFTFFIYYSGTGYGYATVMTSRIFNTLVTAETLGRFTPWVFTVYILIIGAKIIKAGAEWLLFKKQFRSGLVKPSVELKLFATAQQYHFGIKRKVQLWFSNTISIPVTFGFLKPVIVLPVALVNQLSVKQAETLILHELAHIKANDFLLNWFLITAETVFFFNPFIASLCKKIKLEREKYCDITVTAFDYSPLLYAETLLAAQTVKQQAPQLPAEGYRIAAVNKPEHLLNRIRFFVNPANQLQQQKRKLLLPLLSLVLLTVTGLAVLLQLQTGTKNNAAAVQIKQAAAPATFAETIPAIINTAVKDFTDEKTVSQLSAITKNLQPVIEKKAAQLAPVIKEIQAKAAGLSAAMEENLLTPVALQENEAVQQIVVKEERSGSKNATLKVYNLIFKDGKWRLQPQWKLAAKEISPADSLRLTDTTNPPQENTELQD